MKKSNKIDVHHHIFPKEYLEALRSVGVDKSLGVNLPKWTVETSLKKMKENGVKIAMLSIPTPGVYPEGAELTPSFSKDLARKTNEIVAGYKRNYPENFGGFATISLMDTQAAIAELNYALDTLKLDGVCLFTNYKGRYLGDPLFDPFFKELNRHKAVVHIHPSDPGDEFASGLGIPNALIEVTFDTTRAVANMMYQGTLDRYPDIRYILSHGGGTIPYLAWRLASIEYGQAGKRPPVMRALYDLLIRGEPSKGLAHLKSMYYDTANVSGDYQVKALKSFAGTDHMIFGTDLCISKLAAIITKNLNQDGEFSEEEYNKISFGNGLKLFPSLGELYN
jgi:predicted TIM-barrel fold metal-dependent hydrolase